MADSLLHDLLHTNSSRGLSAAQLESLGKTAASRWSDGRCPTLTDAVTTTIKSAEERLTPEQVKRVVEFANTEAYLCEFHKEGSHKIVCFGPAGPANPADVLRDLNAIGGVTVKGSGLGDYSSPPEKRASAGMELSDLFPAPSGVGYPEENPYQEAIDLREKLGSAYALTTDQLSGLETMFQDLSGRLYGQVKLAALEGVSLGSVVQAWEAVSSDPVFVKAAFDYMAPRLFADGVFPTLDAAGASLMKTAGVGAVPNVEHPLVHTYYDFCTTLSKLAELREQQEEYRDGYEKISAFLSMLLQKEAAGVGDIARKALGPKPTIMGLMNRASGGIEGFAKKQLHMGDTAASLLGFAGGKVLPVIGAYKGMEMLGQGVKDVGDEVGITPYIPGTNAYQMRHAQAMGYA